MDRKSLDVVLSELAKQKNDCEHCVSGGCDRPWSPSCPNYKGGYMLGGYMLGGRCKKYSGKKTCIRKKKNKLGRKVCGKYDTSKLKCAQRVRGKKSAYQKFVKDFFKSHFRKGDKAQAVMKQAAAAWRKA